MTTTPDIQLSQAGSRDWPPAAGGSIRHIRMRRLPRGSPAGRCEDACP